MIIQRLYSTKEKEGQRDANAMVTAGKLGFQVAGGAGALAGAEIGRSLYHANKVRKDLGELKKLKDNKEIRKSIKKAIIENEPIPFTGEKIVEKVKWAEKNFPKFSKVDKAQKAVNWWNKSSKLSRTALNNAERYTNMAIEHIIDKKGKGMTEEEKSILRKLPKSVKHAAKSGTALKNAKAIGKVGLVAGNAGALLYLNGRSLQTGADRPTKSVKHIN